MWTKYNIFINIMIFVITVQAHLYNILHPYYLISDFYPGVPDHVICFRTHIFLGTYAFLK